MLEGSRRVTRRVFPTWVTVDQPFRKPSLVDIYLDGERDSPVERTVRKCAVTFVVFHLKRGNQPVS